MNPALNRYVNSSRLGLSNYKRDQIICWVITALERSGRDKEIIPLCEKEAPITASYTRLVNILIGKKQYDKAEEWIQRGISQTKDQFPGITTALRELLLNIRTKQKKPESITSLRVYEYVYYPSVKAYQECKETSEKIKKWERVRTCILTYHETGKLPLEQKECPLLQPDVEFSGTRTNCEYPMIRELISIYIFEKDPEKVLFWYDRGITERRRWFINTDEIANAIKTYSPERAVEMWKVTAEGLINRVNPSAYRDAAVYLRKAEKVMNEIKKHEIWDKYILELRNIHIRKIRLLEILDRMNKKPISKIR